MTKHGREAMKRLVVFLSISLLLSCGDERDRWMDGKIRERKPESANVDIYLTQKPTRPYKEIALLRFETFGNPEKLMRHLKIKSRELGGDAALLLQTSGDSETQLSLLLFSKQQPFTNAVVIEYTDGQ